MADLTISQKLDSIINTKANIKQAIINKGQQVNDVFDTYAAAIENIQTSPSVENLDTELNTQDNLLNTQNITISNISNALNGKSLPGGGSIDGNNVYNLDAFSTTSATESILNYVKIFPTEIDMSNKTTLSYLFSGCQYMTNVPNLINFDGNNGYVDLIQTFSNCKSLTEININLNNTRGINQMGWLFSGCHNLKTINFIQPNAFINENDYTTQDMGGTFAQCSNLTNINIDNGYIVPATMYDAFADCYNIVDLSNIVINISQLANDPTYTFSNCYNLVNFPIFEGESDYSVYGLYGMFTGCKYLNNNTLDDILNRLNLTSVSDISSIFLGCTNLNILPSQLNYDNIGNFNYSFIGINVSDINLSVSKASALQKTFGSTYNIYNETTQEMEIIETNSPLTNLTLTNCNSVQFIDEICMDCKNLKSVNIGGLSTNLYQCGSMFANCYNLTNVEFENCDFSSTYQCSSMFANCHNLVNCPTLNNLGTSLQTAQYMFANCYNLVSVPTINVEQCPDVIYMFENCYNLSNQSLENILNMKFSASGYTYSAIGITENQFNIMKNLPSFQNAVNNGWSNEYI